MPPLYAHDPFLVVQNTLAAPWLDVPMGLASIACEGWAIALLAAAFLWSRERNVGRGLRAAVPLVGGLVLAGMAAQLLKRVVNVPRPLAVLGSGAVHVVLEPLHGRAFPSGHAAAVAALAVFASRRYGASAWPLWLLAAAGGLSRVYVGAHWTLDVVAGWALGAAAAVAAELAVRSAGARLQRLSGAAPAAD